MRVRKQKVKMKPRKPTLSPKRRQLARKIAKNRALHTRLLFLHVRRIVTEVSMKSSKKLLSRYAGYRRARRTVIERKVASQIQHVVNQRTILGARVVGTSKPARRLYVNRTCVVRAARRRLRLRVRQYRRRSPRLVRARLHQYQHVLRRYRSLRRQRLGTALYRRCNLRTIRSVLPFLRTSFYPAARRRTRKFQSRAALRAIRGRRSRRQGVNVRRRMLARRPKYKQNRVRRHRGRKTSQILRKKPVVHKRAHSLLRVGLSLRSVLKSVKNRHRSRKGKFRRIKKLKL